VIQTLPRPILRWAALFHDCGKPVTFSRATGEITFHGHETVSAGIFKKSAQHSGLFKPEEVTRVASVIRLLGQVEQYRPEWTDSAVRRLGLELGDLVDDVLAVARADCTTKNSATRRRVQQRCHELGARLTKVKELDSTPNALPHGLGDAVMSRLGFKTAAMSQAQRLEMGRVMRLLKIMVEVGELPRSGDIALYMQKLEGLL
jgi:poly(A) polymerase